MTTFTIKRMLVKHQQCVTNLKEKYEKWVSNRYGVTAYITDGGWVFVYDNINYYSVHSLWAVFWKSLLSEGAILPNNWREIAEEVAVYARNMKNAAEVMGMDILDIPEEFMSYMYEYRKGYEEWLSENAEEPYYM